MALLITVHLLFQGNIKHCQNKGFLLLTFVILEFSKQKFLREIWVGFKLLVLICLHRHPLVKEFQPLLFLLHHYNLSLLQTFLSSSLQLTKLSLSQTFPSTSHETRLYYRLSLLRHTKDDFITDFPFYATETYLQHIFFFLRHYRLS